MNFSTQTELAAIVLTIAVHIVGAAVLLWGMIDHDDPDRGSWRDWWPRDHRDDDGPSPDPSPAPSGDVAVPVLPASTPAPGRVREGARIGDLTPRRDRRPAHPATPVPTPQRSAD